MARSSRRRIVTPDRESGVSLFSPTIARRDTISPMGDILEKNTATQISFTAITERAISWMRDYCGTTPIVTYRLTGREKTARQFRHMAKSQQLAITLVRPR